MKDEVNTFQVSNFEQYRDLNWGANQLLNIFLFKPFSLELRKRIYALGTIQLVKTAAHAVIEGEPSRGIYLILNGQLSVYKTEQGTHSSTRLATLGPGDTFGELSLLDKSPRSATVAADISSHLFVLDAHRFESFLDREGDGVKSTFIKIVPSL